MGQVREHWSSKLGFMLAAIGSAVGLGVLWKFPYTVGQNGGGLFLLCYIVAVALLGVPLLIGELALGRKTQKAAVQAFAAFSSPSSSWKVGGVLAVLSSFFIMAFYSVIAGWGLSFVLMSISGIHSSMEPSEVSQAFDYLAGSGSITVFWHFLFTLITVGIVVSGVRRGIEFWAKIMTRALFVILIGFICYNATLDGFGEALSFIFRFDTASFSTSSLLEALGLAFFTLSLGQGIMISYGSYMKQDDNIPFLSGIIGLSVIVVAVLAALVVFPVIFTYNLNPSEGFALIFKTLPYLFAQQKGSLVLATLFFSLFVFAALTSALPFIEVIATNCMEKLGWSRRRSSLLVGLATFTFGIPCALATSGGLFANWEAIYGINFFQTVDHLVSVWLIPVGGLVTALFIGWKIPKHVLLLQFPSTKKWQYMAVLWLAFMRYLVPLVIFIIICQKSGVFS